MEQFLFFCVGGTTVFIPGLLFFIDGLDLITTIQQSGWYSNINISFWKSFIETYFSSLAGAILGGAILLFVTKLQLDRTKEDSEEELKEEKRLSNLPCIEYSLPALPKFTKEKYSFIEVTKEENKNVDTTDIIYLKLKNIGINTAKKCAVSIKGESIGESIFYDIDNQGLLPVNKEKDIVFTIANAKEKDYNYIMTVIYQDLMSNKYIQEIKLSYQLKYTKSGKPQHQKIKIEISDEKFNI